MEPKTGEDNAIIDMAMVAPITGRSGFWQAICRYLTVKNWKDGGKDSSCKGRICPVVQAPTQYTYFVLTFHHNNILFFIAFIFMASGPYHDLTKS